jgi:hypothetical protein
MSDQADLDGLMGQIDKLCRHVEALQKDAQQLSRRLTPYEGEDQISAPPWTKNVQLAFYGDRKKPITLQTLHIIVKQADRQLEGAEADFRCIRAKVEAIANDAYLAADWKGWLDRGAA